MNDQVKVGALETPGYHLLYCNTPTDQIFGVKLSGGVTELTKSQYLLLDQRVLTPMKRQGNYF